MADFVRESTKKLDAIRRRAATGGDMDTLEKCARLEAAVLGLEAEVLEQYGIRW